MVRILLLGVLLLAPVAARADIRPGPGPRPPVVPPAVNRIKVNLVVDERASEARIIIPQAALGQQAAPGGFGGARGEADPAEAAPEAIPERRAADTLPTVVSGLALTASLSLGGLWLARRHGRGARVLLATAAVGLALAGGAYVWADLGPFPRGPVRPPPANDVPALLPALLRLEGVRVDVVPQGDAVRVILTGRQRDLLLSQGR